MIGAEWWPAERALLHIAKALDVSPLHAGDELMHAVEEGRVAFADRNGESLVIEREYWARLRGAVRVKKWNDDYERLLADFYFKGADVEREFSFPDAAKAKSTTSGALPGHGGRTPDYDWEAVMTELVRFADKEGLGQSKSAVFRHLANWYSDSNGGKGPSWKTVEKQIDRYLVHMRKPRRRK